MNDTAIAKPGKDLLATTVLAPPDPATVVVAPTMLDLFGKPPLLRSEDANLYDALLSRVVAAARPRDPFEWMLLKDYADLAWEIFRLRRAKMGLIDGRHRSAVLAMLHKLGFNLALAAEWHSNPEVKATLLKRLADCGIDEEIITAEAIVGGLDRLGALDARIAAAEQRRNAALHEIDRHRAGLATRLRGAREVIEAETEDTPRLAAASDAHTSEGAQ
jgi:hypothetical protein